MSNFYLCDVCALKMDGDHLNTCVCVPSFPREHRKLVAADHHGRGGARYDDPGEICPRFKARKE